MNAQDLKYLFQSTSFAMAQEDIRVYLNGLSLEKVDNQLIAVATDGHRLAVCKIDIPANISASPDETASSFRIVLPRKSILELIKLLDYTGDNTVNLMISDSHFYVMGEHYTLATKQLNCQYPHYAGLIPKNTDKQVRIEREPFKQMLSRVSVLANEKKRGVSFRVIDNLLKIDANNAEHEAGEDEMEVALEGASFETSFNISYVMDVLNNLPSIEIKMTCSDPNAGVLFESEVLPQVQYLIMPMAV